jgi:hypothetical protein
MRIERDLKRPPHDARINLEGPPADLPNGVRVTVSSTPSCQHYMHHVRADSQGGEGGRIHAAPDQGRSGNGRRHDP